VQPARRVGLLELLEPRLYLTAPPVITGFSTDTGAIGDRITSDNTLTVDGTATAGNTVRVYFNSVLQGTTTADVAGAWSFGAGAKANGIYSITARAVNSSGTVSVPSGAFAVTIDAAAPAAPTITGFSTDTGVVGDHTTSDTTLTVTGSAESASIVTLYFDGVSQGTTTTAANGTWSLAISEKPEGTYQITASAGDAAGNASGLSSVYPVTIDTTAPAAPTITGYSTDSGVIGDFITNDNTPTIVGTAEPLSSVIVFFNGVSQGTAPVNANGSWTFTASQLDGTYDVTATAQDAAGNTGPTSAPLTLTIDTVAPNAPIITSFSTDTGEPGDRVTADTTLSITGTAEPVSRVVVYFNGASQGSTTADDDGDWSFALAEKPEGEHDITATAQDVAGNTSDPSDPLTVTIDSGPPAAPVITSFSIDTGISGDRITNDNTLTIIGTAEANSTLTVYFDGVSQGITLVASNGTWSFDAAAKPDGVYSITATARDSAGGVSPASNPLVVTIDTVAPGAPTITGFSTDTGTFGDRITADNTLSVTGTAEAASTVTVYFNGVNQGTTVAAANGLWTFDAAPKPDGVYAITASAQDVAGNSSAASGALTVTIDSTSPSAPTITSFSTDTGIPTDRVTSDNTLTVVGTAEAASVVSVYFNGVFQGTTIAGANSTWTFDAAPQADGIYTITGTARDAAGNTSAPSNSLVVTIDHTPPVAPTITGFSTDTGTVGDSVTSDNTLTVFGTSESGTTVTVSFNNSVQGSVVTAANGTWTFNAVQKPDGMYTITATAQDLAGNSTAAVNFLVVTIDSTIPSTPTITGFSVDSGVVGDRITNDNTLTVTGTADAGSMVTVLFNGMLQGTVIADANSTWTLNASQKPDGVYTITASVSDGAGNTSPASNSLVVTIDTVAPGAPIITGYSTDTGPVGDGITSDNTLTVTGTAEAGSTVAVTFNGLIQGTTTTAANGTWTMTAPPVIDGVYMIQATAQDVAGNTSPASNSLVVTVDSSAGTPTITGFSTDTGTVGDAITFDPTLTITGTADPGCTVTISFNGVVDGTTIPNAAGNWTYNASTKPDGVYSITSRCSDPAGNSSGNSTPLVVTIDTTAPPAPLIIDYSTDTGTPGDDITSDPTPTITGTAEPNCTVTVSINGTTAGTTTANSSGNWTFNAASKPDGVYTIVARCTDVAGNPSGNSTPLVITIDSTAPGAPVITSVSTDTGIPTDGITSDNTLIVAGTAEPLSVVTIFFNGTVQGTTTAASSGAWTFNAPQQVDGTYTITANASDVAGNISPASGPRNVTIDTIAPPIPFVTVTMGQTHQGASEPGAIVTAYVNGVARGTTTAASDGGWSITLTGAAETDTITFDAADAAANRSPETAPALDSGGSCTGGEGPSTSPFVDTNFNPITGKGTANNLLMVRERAYEVSPDLRIYGAPGKHTYVQSLMFHTRDDEGDTEATAATVTFGPGITILTTVTSAKLLGGAKHDSRATYADAMFGIFNPASRGPDWNKYSGQPRGLENGDNRFEIVNDGTNGQPAVLEIDFPTRVGPDQGRVLVDYGDCWSTSLSVNIQFHASRASRGYVPYQGLITPTQDFGSSGNTIVPLYANATTISQITDDNGSSATDHVTSDDTPLISGQTKPGASVRLALNGQVVDKVLADGMGRWSYLFSDLDPGNYKVRADADLGGLTIGSSQLFSFVIIA
jgi:hypothetical protein